MKRVPDARMVDIQIIEVPHKWKGKVPAHEIQSMDNKNEIHLVHQPSGIRFVVGVEHDISDSQLIAKQRAEAKLAFIRELTADPRFIEGDE